MGIKGFIRLFLEQEMAAGCKHDYPPPALKHHERPLYGIEDNMHIIKSKPDDIVTIDQFKRMVAEHHMARINRKAIPLKMYISLFDRRTHPVKAAIEHEKRDLGIERWPAPPEGEAIFDESRPNDVLDVFLPDNWRRFCRSRDLVRRHLYPLIFNTLIDPNYVHLAPGERIVLHGVPGQWHNVVPRRVQWQDSEMARGPVSDVDGEPTVPVLCPRGPVTQDEEDTDPDVYNRIWVMEGRRTPEGSLYMHGEQWVEACNSIAEADLAICYYQQYFPNHDCLVYGNDGDFIPILLGYAHERRVGRVWRSCMWLRMKNKRLSPQECAHREYLKRKRDKGASMTAEEEAREAHYQEVAQRFRRENPGETRFVYPNASSEMFYDMNYMWSAINAYNSWGAAGVQNHVLSFICLAIMADNDFFKNMIPGVATDRTKNHIWSEFMERPQRYRYLFQLSKQLEPDPCAIRDPVIDEELFIEFCHGVYIRAWYASMVKDERETLHAAKEHAKATGQTLPPPTIQMVQASLARREERRQSRLKSTINTLKKKLAKLEDVVSSRSGSAITASQAAAHTREREQLLDKLQKQKASRTSKQDAAKNRVQSQMELRVLCRRLLYAVRYWYNGYRDADYPNPAQHVDGLSVFGFQTHPQHEDKLVQASSVIHTLPEDIPDVYSKWFLAQRRQRRFQQRQQRIATGQATTPSLLSPNVAQDVVNEDARLQQIQGDVAK